MTVLKWLVIIVAVLYLVFLAVLFFKQRSMLFPIPPVGRTAPEAAGFPEAEEQVLTTADGEKVIIWHVPAKPGHAVILYFPGNGDFLAGRVSRFRGMTSDGTGLVALSYRGYAGSSGKPSEQGFCRMPRLPMPSRQRNTARTGLWPGAFRSAPASQQRWRPSIRSPN